MLLTRVLTALALVPLVVWGVLALPVTGLTIFLAIISALSAYEWGQFALAQKPLRAVYAAFCGAVVLLLPQWLENPTWVALPALVFWVALTAWMGAYPRGFVHGVGQAALRLPIGALILWFFSAAVFELAERDGGRVLILLTLVLVWAMDVGGYFFGKQFGKHKLAPQVSPNKSWEGLWGGALLALLVAAVASFLILPRFAVLPLPAAQMCVLGVVVAVLSVIGDLAESMFKRQSDVKDSGALLPGHGGLLDRLDSSYTAMPVMLAGLVLLA